MREIFREQIALARGIENAHEQCTYLMSLIRAVLQHAAIGAYEQFDNFVPRDLIDDEDRIRHAIRSLNDSSPQDVLCQLIPAIRSSGWPSYCRGWFEKSSGDGSADLYPIANQVDRWVQFRNNRPGHGVLDRKTVEDQNPWLLLLADELITILSEALPVVVQDTDHINRLYNLTPGGRIESATLRLANGRPIVIRRVSQRRGVWVLSYQVLDPEESTQGFYELDDKSPLLQATASSVGRFVTMAVPSSSGAWQPLVRIPNRQTFLFEGREEEVDDLYDWLDDTDSRMCLVYGDGGMGKTTLVLEVLHDVLECSTELQEFRPDIICFYTAKLTKWTAEGLIRSRELTPVLADAIRQLASVFENTSKAEWHAIDDRALIDKVAGIWSDAGLSRDKVLLIVDNSETLAIHAAEEKNLQKLLRQVSRKLARLIVTSRRFEKIEARQVEVNPLDEESGAALLRSLANEYSAKPLQKAGDSRLRKLVRDLNGKPLLLEIIAKHLSNPGVTINVAVNKVRGEVSGDLGEFLYDDAWRRIADEHRIVFMILAMVDVPITKVVVGWVCESVKTLHQSWLVAFSETHFGDQHEIGIDYDISFVQEALVFFDTKRKERPEEDQELIRTIAREVSAKYLDLQRSDGEYESDRIAQAFNTSAARAAKAHAIRGDYPGARLWYEEAIKVDANNAALMDRYAFFLMHFVKDLDAARQIADRAIALDKEYSESYFTASMVAYRQFRLDEGDAFIDKAESLGKPRHLCLFQKGRSRVHASFQKHSAMHRRALLNEALELYEQASRDIPASDPYYSKNLWDFKEAIEKTERSISALGERTSGAALAPRSLHAMRKSRAERKEK